MIQNRSSGLAVLLLAAVFLTVPAGAADFSLKPEVSAEGNNVVITFEADASTDCAVYVLDGDSKVIRHLAAGMLGKNAPAPLKKNSLAQSLVWDRKNDLGVPAADGPFKVKVGLRLKPVLDRFIGENLAATSAPWHEGESPVRALAVGPGGELFLFHMAGEVHPGDGTVSCTVFTREGKYLRTILPYPANIPENKMQGIKRVKLPDGLTVPFVYQADVRAMIPGGGNLPVHRAVATKDGRIAFVAIHERHRNRLRYNQPGIVQVMVLNSDGSMPAGGPFGPLISQLSTSRDKDRDYGDRISRSGASLALSPDEKTIYATGYWEGNEKFAKRLPTHAVYKLTWESNKEAEVFLGHKTEKGSGKNRFNVPIDVDTDRDGNIYVADRENNRIAVFKPDGTYMGELKTERPDRIQVHPKTGAVYVMGGQAINLLQKFTSWKETEPVAKLTTPCRLHRRKKDSPTRTAAVIALDATADPAVLWFAPSQGTRYTLLRVEDLGEKFSKPVDVGLAARKEQPSASSVFFLSVDRTRERLYSEWQNVNTLKVLPWNGRTGEFIKGIRFPKGGGGSKGMSVGLDGRCYWVYKYGGICRCGPDLKEIPFPKADPAGFTRYSKQIISAGTMRITHGGFTADAHGNVYVLSDKKGMKNRPPRTPSEAADARNLAVYSPEGELITFSRIDSEIRGINSPRLDYAGNIYVLVAVRPPGKNAPDDFKDTDLGKRLKGRFIACEVDWYPFFYGCVVKFGPNGGVVRKDAGGISMEYGHGSKIDIKDAEWAHYGASSVPSWATVIDDCMCAAPCFDVDGFGRSFFPDAGRFRCGVLDTAGNLICTFGSYGNQDSRGPGSAVPVPDIPFCWPQAVAVSDEAAYVGDRLNRRVVRVKLAYEKEETVTVE